MSFLSGDDGDDWWSNKIESEVKFPLTNFDLTKQFPNYPKDITTPIFDLFTVVVSYLIFKKNYFLDIETCF